jgi:Ni,Fe-hydrogenase I small subunit
MKQGRITVSEEFSRRGFLTSSGVFAATAFLNTKRHAAALQKTSLETHCHVLWHLAAGMATLGAV